MHNISGRCTSRASSHKIFNLSASRIDITIRDADLHDQHPRRGRANRGLGGDRPPRRQVSESGWGSVELFTHHGPHRTARRLWTLVFVGSVAGIFLLSSGTIIAVRPPPRCVIIDASLVMLAIMIREWHSLPRPLVGTVVTAAFAVCSDAAAHIAAAARSPEVP